MSTKVEQRNAEYYYNHAIESFLVQFMTIFSDLKVEIGKKGDREKTLIKVGIHYGYPDRVVAALIAKNTQNVPIRLPTMTAVIRNINLAPELYKGVGVEHRTSYVPVGGVMPEDINVVHRRQPVPYKLDIDLSILASNTNQHYQILEQIMMVFDPTMTIQKSDGVFDWSRLTTVTLTNISIDSNYPIGTDRKLEQSTLTFSVPIYIDIPAVVRNQIVEDIFLRISAVSGDLKNKSSDDIIAELDAQGINYTQFFNAETDVTVK